MSIVVQRAGALGDVILTTPIIRRLRRENPTTRINVVTGYPDVFRNSPYLDVPLHSPLARKINLDLVYERWPGLHIVQAYMEHVFGDPGEPDDLQQELFFGRPTVFSHGRHYVAVHAAVAGWANRTLPRATWRAVVAGLIKAGLWPVLVGSPRDDIPQCDVTRFHSTDIMAQARLIAGCAAFVGSDSGLLHVAGATEVPIVGVFTCATAHTRLPWRHGQLGWRCIPVVPDLDCVGCQARRPAPVTDEHCERGDTACVEMVSASTIVAAVVAAIDTGN